MVKRGRPKKVTEPNPSTPPPPQTTSSSNTFTKDSTHMQKEYISMPRAVKRPVQCTSVAKTSLSKFPKSMELRRVDKQKRDVRAKLREIGKAGSALQTSNKRKDVSIIGQSASRPYKVARSSTKITKYSTASIVNSNQNAKNIREIIVPFMESTITNRRGIPRKGRPRKVKGILIEELEQYDHFNTTGCDNSFPQTRPRRITSSPKVSSRPATLPSPKQKYLYLDQVSGLGLTNIAASLDDDSTDPDEVDSILDTSLVKVDEYIVKKETAPLLKSILDKQGDIAKHWVVETTMNRSSLLENVCGLYQKLEKKDHKSIKICEVKSMLVEVEDFEKAGLEVKWFKERLDEIAEALEESKGYFALKKEVEMKTEAAERKRKELEELKEKTRVTENELAAIEASATELSERMLSTKAKWASICGQSMVQGLL